MDSIAITDQSQTTAKDENQSAETKQMKAEIVRLIGRYDKRLGFVIEEDKNYSSSLVESEEKYADYALSLTTMHDYNGMIQQKVLSINAKPLRDICNLVIGKSDPTVSFNTQKIKLNCPPKTLFWHLDGFERLKKDWDAKLIELRAEKEKWEKVDENSEREPPVTDKETEKSESVSVVDLSKPDEDVGKTLEKLEEDLKYLDLLLKFMHHDMGSVISNYRNLIPQKLITYELLWAIFPPGTLYVTTQNILKEPALHRTIRGTEIDQPDGKFFALSSQCIDYDGYHTGYSNVLATIEPFEGTMLINDLGAVPLEFLPNVDKVMQSLIKRGKRAAAMTGPCHMHYKGFGLGEIESCKRKLHSINGRVIVDTETFCRINPDRAISVHPLSSKDKSNPDCSQQYGGIWGDDFVQTHPNGELDPAHQQGLEYNIMHRYDNQTTTCAALEENRANKPHSSQQGGAQTRPLSDLEYAMFRPFVRGFALGVKKWVEMAVTLLTQIKFQEEAFSKLVLPPTQKEVILSLVSDDSVIVHLDEDNSDASPEQEASPKVRKYEFDDIIASKGQGLVAVLHGPPGVGKTLTAESVAEYTRRPLYSVTSGELGTTACELEDKLALILDIAGTWNAILLIDEADIFLEARSMSSAAIERNAMVAIFLRLLEYFRGTMFLTTNRVESFDLAFKSRIHIAMKYNNLDEDARCQVWKNFFSNIPKELIEDSLASGGARILALQWEHVNGREIKNAIKTALKIASRRGEKLNMVHLAGVLKLGVAFEEEFGMKRKAPSSSDPYISTS